MKTVLTIFGDCILDEYVTVQRVKNNPEMLRGNVWATTAREYRAGGAAAVAALGAGMGASCALIGPIGQDAAGATLGAILDGMGVSLGLSADVERVTPHKVRHVHNGRLLPDRFDSENYKPFRIPNYAIAGTLIIADYGKGACDNVETPISAAINSNICERIIVDPAPETDWRKYLGADIIKANHKECVSAATQLGFSCEAQLPEAIAAFLAKKLHCEIILTKDESGLFLSNGKWIPAQPTNVVDVCGAGDTVTVAIAIALDRCATLEYACEYAAKLAAMQVSRLGVSRVCL